MNLEGRWVFLEGVTVFFLSLILFTYGHLAQECRGTTVPNSSGLYMCTASVQRHRKHMEEATPQPAARSRGQLFTLPYKGSNPYDHR